jgi:hypothetical protein
LSGIRDILDQSGVVGITGQIRVENAIDRVSKSDLNNLPEIAASQLEIINSYYQGVLAQAQRSFLWALIAAGVGLGFFIGSVVFLITQQSNNLSAVSLISGALIEVISAINFYLYAKASSQLAAFHVALERTQRMLMANSICELIEGDLKQSTRADLVRRVAGLPVASLPAEVPQPTERAQGRNSSDPQSGSGSG